MNFGRNETSSDWQIEKKKLRIENAFRKNKNSIKNYLSETVIKQIFSF